jgi:hypothetical protein
MQHKEDKAERNGWKTKGCFETCEIRKQEKVLGFLRVCSGMQKHHLVPRSKTVELFLYSPHVFMTCCWIN